MMVEFHMADGTRVDVSRLRDLELEPLGVIVRNLPTMHPDTQITLGGYHQKKVNLRIGDIRRVAIWDGLRLVAENTRFTQQH